MLGKPVIQGALFTLAWLLLSIPILYVTREAGAESVASPSVDDGAQAEAFWLSLRFTTPPAFFEVTQAGRTLWRVDDVAETIYEERVTVEVDALGVELGLRAEFPDADVAVEIALEASGRERRSQTLWVSGEVDEFVAFSWGRDE